MAQFGLPRRNATQDANAGVVNPPSLKRAPRQQAVVKQQATSLDVGVQELGDSLGRALSQRLDENAHNINERRATEAAIRQGQDHAINEIDEVKKRTGWERAVFGDNVEYRAAQQRAAQNAVNDAYLEQASSISEYAGETPDEYSLRLKDGLDNLLEPYGNDADTKRILTATWMVHSAKLASKQYQEHYAYNQTQQRETFSNQVQKTLDTWTVDASLANTDEQRNRVKEDAAAFFTLATKPAGMDDISARSVIHERLNESLANGNVGAYKSAKTNGWFDNMTMAETVGNERAVKAYRAHFGKEVAKTYEDANLEALEAKTLEQAVVIYTDLRRDLDALNVRMIGEDEGNELSLTRGHIVAQKGINRANEAIRKREEQAGEIGRRAAEAAEEARLKKERIDEIASALMSDDPVYKAGVLNKHTPKPSELKEILDTTLVSDIGRIMGNPDMNPAEATRAMLTNPTTVAKYVARHVAKQEIDSPFVKRSVETFLNGITGLGDEDDRLNETGKTALASIGQFTQNKHDFKNLVGDTNYDRYDMIRQGVEAGNTLTSIQKHLDEYSKYKGNRDAYAIDWDLQGMSKRDKVQQVVSNVTGSKPYGASLSNYMVDFDRALVVTQGDMRAATDRLTTQVLGSYINYQGHAIANGKRLNEVTDYNFSQLLDTAQKTNLDGSSALTPYLAALGMDLKAPDGTTLSNIKQVPGFKMYTVDGMDGFYIDANGAGSPVPISEEVMQRWAQKVTEDNNRAALRRRADTDFLDNWEKSQTDTYRPGY